MKPRQAKLLILAVATIAAASMQSVLSSPIPSRDAVAQGNQMDRENPEKLTTRHNEEVIETCLTIAPNLPPCNFHEEATWRSSSGEISHGDSVGTGSGFPVGTQPKFQSDVSAEDEGEAEDEIEESDAADETKDGSSMEEKNLGGLNPYENDLDITIVYYLEGCLPERLPFDLPSCTAIEQLKTIQMNKLVPFKLPAAGYELLEDAFIFPEIDVKQIEFYHRQSKASSPAASPTPLQTAHRRDEPRSGGSKRKMKMPDALTANKIEDIKNLSKGIQDFNKIMLKSNMMPRTGTASKKYDNMLPGYSTGFASMSSTGEEGSYQVSVAERNNEHHDDFRGTFDAPAAEHIHGAFIRDERTIRSLQ